MTKSKKLSLWTMRSVLAVSIVTAPAARAHAAEPSFDRYLGQISSSGLMSPDELKVIMDNQQAFDQKISTLRSAAAGDQVYMTYYIHDNDESTSKINQEIIAAARRGARVNLMIDFLTNYNQLDAFNMLSKQGQGRIDIRFFNPPTQAIQRDVMYMTTDCPGVAPAACRKEKEKQVAKAFDADNRAGRHSQKLIGSGHFFSRLFLAGLSGKRHEALKTAIMEGGTLPDMDAAAAAKPTADEKKQLMEFAQLLFGAKVLHNTGDKIKLMIALVLYGEDVRPIYQKIDNALPLSLSRPTSSGKDWEAISQFTHQKGTFVISADGSRLESATGGRNLQSSYHVNEDLRSMTPKYLFADTDIWYKTRDRDGVKRVHQALQRLFNSEMVIGLDEVNRLLPVDYIMEIDLIKKVIAENKNVKNVMESSAYAALIEEKVREALDGRAEAREKAQFIRMNEGAAKYAQARAAATAAGVKVEGQIPRAGFELDSRDTQAKVAYVETLTFRAATAAEKAYGRVSELFGGQGQPDEVRIYDPVRGQEVFDNKGIPAEWIASFKHQAAEAARERKVRTLYINQGYVYPSSNIVKLFGEMIDGTINSEFIRIKLFSNSIETTDLSAINLLARHQIKALYEYHEQNVGRPGALKSLEFFELALPADGRKTSLHSKMMIMHDTAHVGSSNLEVRSARTDTNNEVVLTNARHTVAKMEAYMEGLLRDPAIAKNVTATYRRPHTLFLQEDAGIVKKILSKYKGVSGRIDGNAGEIAMTLMQRTTEVYLMTGLIVDHAGAQDWLGRTSLVAAPEASGAGGGSRGGAALQCSKIMTGSVSAGGAGTSPRSMNTTVEMLSKIRSLKSKYGDSKQIGNLFDRINQLL